MLMLVNDFIVACRDLCIEECDVCQYNSVRDLPSGLGYLMGREPHMFHYPHIRLRGTR